MKLLLTIALAVCTMGATAQSKFEKKPFSKENAFIGGNVTIPLQALIQGQKNVVISLNPHYGYSVKPWLDLAGVLNIQTAKFDNTQANYTNILNTGAVTKLSMVGIGAFARAYLLDVVFLHIQPELNLISKRETKYSFNASTFQVTQTELPKASNLQPSFLVGAGYKQGFRGGSTFGYVSVLYDVFTKNSPYSNAVVQTITGSNQTTPIIFRVGTNIKLEDLKRRR